MAAPRSLTGQYLKGEREVEVPEQRRPVLQEQDAEGHRGARQQPEEHHRRDSGGSVTCVTGVSGGGKSTFTIETLYKAAARRLNNASDAPAHYDNIEGLEQFDKVIDIDQSPIGRTPRSNPATYIGAFTPIRDWFAALPEAKARGYGPGRFSFNVKGRPVRGLPGRWPDQDRDATSCPTSTSPATSARASATNRETLEILFKGKSISEILDMTVDEGGGVLQGGAVDPRQDWRR